MLIVMRPFLVSAFSLAFPSRAFLDWSHRLGTTCELALHTWWRRLKLARALAFMTLDSSSDSGPGVQDAAMLGPVRKSFSLQHLDMHLAHNGQAEEHYAVTEDGQPDLIAKLQLRNHRIGGYKAPERIIFVRFMVFSEPCLLRILSWLNDCTITDAWANAYRISRI
jgi:hypothetical protein